MRGNSRLKPIVISGFAITVAILGVLTFLRRQALHGVEAMTPSPTSRQAERFGGASDVLVDPAGTSRRRRPVAMSPLEARDAVRGIVAERMRASNEQSRQNDRYKVSLAASFRREKKDLVWAGSAESELQHIATGADMTAAGVVVDDVAIECRSSICHTTATFTSDAQADDWVMVYMSSAGTVLRGSAVSRSRSADGSVSVEIFSKASA